MYTHTHTHTHTHIYIYIYIYIYTHEVHPTSLEYIYFSSEVGCTSNFYYEEMGLVRSIRDLDIDGKTLNRPKINRI